MVEEIKNDCQVNAVDLFKNKEINHNNVSVSAIKRYLN